MQSRRHIPLYSIKIKQAGESLPGINKNKGEVLSGAKS